MFTGIIEETGEVTSVTPEGSNVHFEIKAQITPELKIDQSVAHNGVCLTVVDINKDRYTVTAIRETMNRSNLGSLKKGDSVNLERCMVMNGRLDGHIVQGHVDTKGKVEEIKNHDGSWQFYFSHGQNPEYITVEKGSITVNGVSLTVVESSANGFSVAVIPYTFEHTNFQDLQPGDEVNLEFDVIGKYVAAYMKRK